MIHNSTLCISRSFASINNVECLLSRIIGFIIVCASLFSVLFNIRFLFWSYRHRQNRSHHFLLILSMIFSSSLVMLIVVPSVILHNIRCKRLCSLLYCQLEGFISYLNGCVHMFMLMMISLIRYGTVLPTNKAKRYFQQHSYIAVLICWLLALLFAVPPLFNWSKYIPEGLGYHCGLDWSDRSLRSRLYLFFSFLFVYFVPLSLLSVINLRVYCVIRRLLDKALSTNEQAFIQSPGIKARHRKERSSLVYISSSSSSSTHSIKFSKMKPSTPLNGNNHMNNASAMTSPATVGYAIRLRRLKADRHFALATIFLVSEYLLSWTPYACVALFYLYNTDTMIEQSSAITICAFIAKTSVILNPFIYISTIKRKQLTTILYCKKCSCQYCA